MFRDESSHVIKRATKAKARRKQAAAALTGVDRAAAVAGSVSSSSSPSASSPPENLDAATRSRSAGLTPAPAQEPVGFAGVGGDRGSRSPLPGIGGGQKMSLALLTPNMRAPEGIKWNLKPEPDDDLLPSPDEGTWPATPMSDLAYTISPSYQERGTAYFFSRYVAEHENACHQNYDFIYDIWKPNSLLPERQVDGVLASMTAVGLAGLSFLTRCDSMMVWARRSYGTALRLTNEALKNAKEAVKDSTILSVLILGTYEMLTGRTPQTVKAWQEHVHGAAALVSMRGTDQFHSKAGIRMFMMSHQTVMIACMQQDIPMPQGLIDLRQALGQMVGTAEPGWRIPEPIYRALQVRYDVHRGLMTDTDVIIEKLTSIDEECIQICAKFPSIWAYQVVGISKPNPMVLGSKCHIYPSLLIGNAWNGMRTIRLLAHETIIGEIIKSLNGRDHQSIPPRHRRQLARSIAILKAARDAIIASVPQYFGAVKPRDKGRPPPDGGSSSTSVIELKKPPHQIVPSSASEPSPVLLPPPPTTAEFSCPTILDPLQSRGSAEQARVDRFMTVASASHTIVWPLYLVGMASCCTEEIKDYVVDRLDQIANEGALVQARSVALLVQQRRDLRCPWANIPLGDLSPSDESLAPI